MDGHKMKKDNILKTSETKIENNPISGLFNHLMTILEVSEKKFLKKKAKGTDRIKWGRLMVQAIQAYGNIYKLHSLEEIDQRITELDVRVSEYQKMKVRV